VADSRREPKALVIRGDAISRKYQVGHHTCKPYRGDGLTSGIGGHQEERKISWRKAVILE
jgi:hypothetical protein